MKNVVKAIERGIVKGAIWIIVKLYIDSSW